MGKKMRIYSIFDDFGDDATRILRKAGMEITIHPLGVDRPDTTQMRRILEAYDGVIIGTSQKMYEDVFINITTPKVIATASVGLDHIRIPDDKKVLVTVINTPKANAQSVAEYTIGCALACCKRLLEGRQLYTRGENNKKLSQKPEDLYGKTLGVVGAGNISTRIMEFGKLLGMNVICWTIHPENHLELSEIGVRFVDLSDLLGSSDVVSVNLPNNKGTENIIDESKIQLLRDNAIFISVSRKKTVDYMALLEKAKACQNFYVCLDLDVDKEVVESIPAIPNVLITPHIAGGTVSTRKRMFVELAEQIINL